MSSEYIPTEEELSNKLWRLTHLYYITDKSGQQVQFNLNWAQIQLYDRMWHQMLVLKARQLGACPLAVRAAGGQARKELPHSLQ